MRHKAHDCTLVKPRVPRMRPQVMSLLEQPYLPLPMDDNFDEYLQSPILEDLQFSIGENKLDRDCSNWDYFKDYGYRLLPDFTVTFNQQDPVEVTEHIFPVGEPQYVDLSPWDETVVDHLFTNYIGEPCKVLIDDFDVLSTREMLDLSGTRTLPKAYNCSSVERTLSMATMSVWDWDETLFWSPLERFTSPWTLIASYG